MNRIIIILISILFFWSCDSVVDIEPENDVTFTNFFKTEKDAAAVLYGIHSKMGDVLKSSAHDIIGLKLDVVRNDNDYWTGARSLSPSYFAGMDGNPPSWIHLYSLIHRSNMMLDNLFRFRQVSAERLEYYAGQACFAKGIAYFWLARQWGEAPIVPDSYTTDKYPKESVLRILEEAIINGEKALTLPVFDELVDEFGLKVKTKQMGCKGAATALLAQVYAWKAGITNNQADWVKAESYCSDIIEGRVGSYALAESPSEVCKIVMKGNSREGIFEKEYFMDDDPMSNHKPYAIMKLIGYPVVKSATITDYASCEITRQSVKKMFDPEDRRLLAYFTDPNERFYNDQGEEIVVTRAFIRKWDFSVYQPNQWTGREEYKVQNCNRIIWRLADVILLRAECRARLGQGGAIDDLNTIRRRAYGDDKHQYNASEGDIRYVIFKEREKELLFEGHRYYDVMRNGYWATELTEVFSRMSKEEFQTGAQYFPVHPGAFVNSDVMRQNIYWNSKL